jgi:ribosomal subunit interface protein
MKLQITGRNLDVGDALRARISDRFGQVADKYFSEPLSGHVTFTREGSDFRADCLIHVGTGIEFNTEARAGDAHSAAEQALARLEKRLRRYKRRLRDHHAQRSEPAASFDAADYVIRASEDEPEPEGLNPVIIAESKISIRELTVGEAVMQMDISERPFLVFRNGGHGRINVVYRRDDGNIGWIDPDFVEHSGG